MSVFLTPTFGAGWQGFTNAGLVLAGGKLNTYAAGTSTPTTTYNSNSGLVPNANPITLDSSGRIPTSAEMWQTAGQAIKVIIQDSSLNTIATYDNLQGVDDPAFASPFGEWIPQAGPFTFVAANQFSVSGNQTALYDVNRRVKTVNSGGTFYGKITASTYASIPNTTTVTVLFDSGALDSGLSAVSIGILDPANNSVPMSTALVQNILNTIFPNPATDLENILINGDMRISQVNGSGGVAVSNANSYTVDQWLTSCSLGAGTGSISVTRGGPASGLSSGGSQYDLSFTVGTANASPAAGNFCLTQNRSEGLNTQKLNWGNGSACSVTLQFRFFTSIANAVLPIAFVNGALNRSYVTSITTGTASTWAAYSVTIPGDVAGTWTMDNTLGLIVSFGWAVGSTFQTTAGSWQAGQFYGIAGGTNFMASISNSWGLTDVDLKAGSFTLPITRRSVQAELLLCQRYLPVYNAQNTSSSLCPAFAQSATSILGLISFPVTTRVAPTGITISSATHFTQINGAATAALSALVFNSIIGNSSAILVGTSAGMTNGFGGSLYFNNASGQLVFTGAQL